MYNPGGEYLTYIKNSLVRKPRAKIVVDGKTYTGVEHLASFPKITHETEKMIGGFPAKTCDFEIYNLDGTIDLNGKEVQIYRGLYVSDTKTVWVPMGLFYADGEDVTNNSTKRTIQFKGTDRTRLFDSPFTKINGNGVIPAETLISSVAEKICKTHNLAIDSSTKGNIVSHRLSESVGVPEGTTDRQVIAWIAELSGCIPIISRDGSSLVFTRPNYKSNVYDSGQTYPSGSYADKSKYKTLSAEPLFGPINAVSFGHADYDDAYVYQDDADVEANGLHEWQINDNPLAENSKAEFAPKVFNIIKGMKLYPFTLTDFIDDFLFDINDGILIKKKDDTLITTYVLGMSTTSRIRSTFKANTQDSSTADRSLAGSVKEDLKRVKLSVDHINNEITALAKESDQKYTELKQTVDGIDGKIVDVQRGLEASISATAEKATLAYSKAETVEGQINGITDTLTSLSGQITAINGELDGIDDTIAAKVSTEVRKDTTINILAGEVSSKISGNYVTKATYDNEKNNWVLKTDYNSRLNQTDQSIQAAVNRVQKLENAGYITETVCNSLIDQKSDSIALQVESNLQIGARNILLNSECFDGFDPIAYKLAKVIKMPAMPNSALPSGKYAQVFLTANSEGGSAVRGFRFSAADIIGQSTTINKLKPGTKYTLSWYMRTDRAGPLQTLNAPSVIYAGEKASVLNDTARCITPALSETWQRYVITFKVTGTITDFMIRLFFDALGKDKEYLAYISSFKLEEGNIATDWSPSEIDMVTNATYQSFINLLPEKISAGVTSTVTDQYVANKIKQKCASVTLGTDGLTLENGAFILKDENGDIMIDSSGIHSEHLNFGKTIELKTIKNGTVIDENNVDILTLKNYTGSNTGMVNSKSAVSVISNISALKNLFWNNPNNWFCAKTSTNLITVAAIENVEETQVYILSFDVILATTTNGKALLPQLVRLSSDKTVNYEVGVDALQVGSATVSGKTYQYRYGTLSCSVRGYDLIRVKGAKSSNAKISILPIAMANKGTSSDSTSWLQATYSPTSDHMGFIGNIKLTTFVGATLNARALLNANTDYYFDLGTGILSSDEINCKNIRTAALPSAKSTDNLKAVFIDETTGQFYREM